MSEYVDANNKPYILLIGNAGVGKSSYVRKLANQGFSEFYTPTTGYVDTYIPGLYNFIELSGQEPANEYAEEVLTRADRIYLMASKSSKASIENIPFWIRKYEHLHLNYTIIINKCDIASTDFELNPSLHEAVEQFDHYVNIHYISCKDGPMFV
jgi:GTPase SAR1 family protein